MQETFTSANFEVKRGRFLILPTKTWDKYFEIARDVVDGSDEAYEIAVRLRGSDCDLGCCAGYWIHDGFIIANSNDSRECAVTLDVKTDEEASDSLNRFLDDLNSYSPPQHHF